MPGAEPGATPPSDPWESLGRHPLLLSCLGASLLGLSGVLFRISGAAPATATAFRCLYALPLIAAFVLYERRRGGEWTGSRRLAWTAGALLAADLVLWHYSVAYVGAGLASVLGNTQLVFVVLAAALFLGERLTLRLGLAIAAMLAGVVLISGVLGVGAYGDQPLAGAVLGVVSGAAYAGFLLILRRASGGSRPSVQPLLHVTVATALVSALLGLLLGDIVLRPTWPEHGWLLLIALLGQALAWLLVTVPIGRLPAATTAVALTLQPLTAVVYGAVLLGERPSPVQALGVAVVLAGFVVALRVTMGRGSEVGCA